MSSAPIAANQLDVVLRNVADGITAQRADGSLAYANDAAARLLGLESGEQLNGLPGSELVQRFRILDEEGEPMLPDALPNRRAFVSKQPEEGARLMVIADAGKSAATAAEKPSAQGYDAVAVAGGMDDWTSENFNVQPTEDPSEDTELGGELASSPIKDEERQ